MIIIAILWSVIADIHIKYYTFILQALWKEASGALKVQMPNYYKAWLSREHVNPTFFSPDMLWGTLQYSTEYL